MPTPSELFQTAVEQDPVHGPTFRAMWLRPPELVKLSVKEAAAYLAVTMRTIGRWQATDEMPSRVKVGRERR